MVELMVIGRTRYILGVQRQPGGLETEKSSSLILSSSEESLVYSKLLESLLIAGPIYRPLIFCK